MAIKTVSAATRQSADEMSLVLELPPSANRYWRRAGNVMHLSAEARNYKTMVRVRNMAAKPFLCDVAVYLDVYRARKSGDLDNKIKCALDALQGVAYANDSQIVEIHARRFDDKANPRLEVTVKRCEL